MSFRLLRCLCFALALSSLQITELHAQQSDATPSVAHTPIAYRNVEPVSEISSGGGVLALVFLGLAAWGAWYLARKNGVKFPLRSLRNERLFLRETLHLSSRSRIYLVEADGRSYVVGESANGLTISAIVDKTLPGSVNRESSEV